MGILFNLLTGWGLGQRLAKALSWIIPLVLLAAALWWLRADAYGDGQRAEKALWELAMAKAREDAAASAGKASAGSVARQVEYQARVAAEKEKIEQAEEAGTSPLDALFPVTN